MTACLFHSRLGRHVPLHCRSNLPRLLSTTNRLHNSGNAGSINPDSWVVLLAEHPDRAFAGYVTQGLREGFRIGFQWDSPLASATRNMHSTRLRPAAISGYIADERSKGRMLGPLPLTWRPRLQVNRFGLIPKGRNTGKYLICHFPKGAV